MTIIYFLTQNQPEQLQLWLNKFISSKNINKHSYLLEKYFNNILDNNYLKLTLFNDLFIENEYTSLRIAAQMMEFDFFIKSDVLPANGLITFDMDSTFIQEEGVDEIAQELGISGSIAELTQQAMEGKLDFDTSFTRRIRMLKGTPTNVVDQVCNRMTLSAGLTTILPVIKAKGFKTAIISGGLDIFTQRLKEKYHLDYAFSNRVQIEAGLLTDKVIPPIMNAAMKKNTLVDLATQLNIELSQVIACGDGANDIPMLMHAGTGIAWRAKPAVREKVHQQINFNGFESLLFFIEEQL